MMKKLSILAAALGFITTSAASQVPNWPQTLPANSVVGRLGIGPGPAQAIPFDTFQKYLNTAGQNLVYAGPASGGTGNAAFRSLVGADLPLPTTSSLGGVQASNCAASNWINSISTSGVPGCAQPGAADWAAITQTFTLGNSKLSISSTGVQLGRSVNHVRIASLYGQADWCANLVAAIADLGTNPGTILIDSAAGPSACSAGSDIFLGDYHKIQFIDGNVYVLNQTIKVGVGNEIAGVGTSINHPSNPDQGTVLKWTGGTGLPMLYFFGAQFSYLHDIGLNCNAVALCTTIRFDSVNDPITTRNKLERFSLFGYHVGINIGSAATTAVSGSSCASNVNQSGCSENDHVVIQDFQMYANCADTTAEGFRINSLNAIQNSLIANANIGCGNIAVNIINMNDSARFERITFGSVSGTSPTQFRIGAGVVNGPDLWNNESEGGSLTYAVHNSATGGADAYIGNQWNNPVLIDGAARVTSMSNTGGGTWTAAGTSHVVSIGDITTTKWSTSGSGTVTVVGN